MMNKEECLEALEKLKLYEKWRTHPDSDDIQVFAKLINKHFDNPPLKFEELKDGMWVWDNKRKEYFKISEIRQKGRYFFFRYVSGFTKFEENRFYRYEVKE